MRKTAISTLLAFTACTAAFAGDQTETFLMGGQNACVQAINSTLQKKNYQTSSPSFEGNGGVSGSSYVYKFRAGYSYTRGNTIVSDWVPVDCLINPQTGTVSVRINKK